MIGVILLVLEVIGLVLLARSSGRRQRGRDRGTGAGWIGGGSADGGGGWSGGDSGGGGGGDGGGGGGGGDGGGGGSC